MQDNGLIISVERGLSLGVSDEIVAPDGMDVSCYFRPPEQQGVNPWCVAYAVCAVGQAYAWKRYGKPVDFSERAVFEAAKKIDGLPGIGGTTEAAGVTAGIECGALPSDTKRHIIRSEEELKQAMHRFTWVIGGFYMTPAWESDKVGKDGRLQNDWRRFTGAHEVSFVGYSPWGTCFCNWKGWGWGDQGFGWMSWEMFRETFAGGSALEIPYA